MSDIVKVIIVIAILIMVSPLIAEYSGNQIDKQAQTQQDQNDAQNTGNNFNTGDVVCDLEITAYLELDLDRTKTGFFDFNLFQVEFDIYMGDGTTHPEGIDVIHRNCYTVGNTGSQTLAFLSSAYSFTGADLQALNIYTTTPLDNFDLVMTGKSKINQRNLVEGINTSSPQKEWIELVDVNFGTIDSGDLPLRYEIKYFLDDVKDDDYTLTFRADGRSINNMGDNRVITFDVPAQFN